jgi:hypothetical protein
MRPSNTKGISPRALEKIGPDLRAQGFYSALRHVKPQRQEQIAELMSISADRSISFLSLLIAASTGSELVGKKRHARGISHQELAKIERSFRPLENLFRSLAPAYPGNAYALAITEAYLRRVLRNGRVASYLNSVHREMFEDLAAGGLVAQARGNAQRGRRASRRESETVGHKRSVKSGRQKDRRQ